MGDSCSRYSPDTDTCITFSNRSCRLQPRPPHDKVVVVTLVRRLHCVPTPLRADSTTSLIVLNMSKTISEVCRSVRFFPSPSSSITFPTRPLHDVHVHIIVDCVNTSSRFDQYSRSWGDLPHRSWQCDSPLSSTLHLQHIGVYRYWITRASVIMIMIQSKFSPSFVAYWRSPDRLLWSYLSSPSLQHIGVPLLDHQIDGYHALLWSYLSSPRHLQHIGVYWITRSTVMILSKFSPSFAAYWRTATGSPDRPSDRQTGHRQRWRNHLLVSQS